MPSGSRPRAAQAATFQKKSSVVQVVPWLEMWDRVDALTMRAVVWGSWAIDRGRSWLSRKSVTQIEAGWSRTPMSRGRPAIR